MDKKNRPSSYNFFKGVKSGKDLSNKEKFKKTWKWLKVLIYVFISAVTLTGCVQSFAVPNSQKVGTGVEFYNSREEIAPNSQVFVKTAEKYANSDSQVPVVNGRSTEDKEIIKKLEEITAANGGKYGEYGSKSTLIILTDDDKKRDSGQLNIADNNNFLYFNSTFKQYTKQTTWTTLKIPSKKIESSQTTDSPKSNSTLFTVSDKDLGPDVPLSAIFARDVLQVLYDKTLKLEMYKDGKLEKAFGNSTDLGTVSDPESQKIINSFFDAINVIRESTFFTKPGENNTYEYNYTQVNPIPYSGLESKPIISWGDAWNLGPFFGLVAFPLARIMTSIVYGLPFLSGWESVIAIFIAVIITRLISFMVTFKSIFSQSKQEELQVKKAKIDSKYAPYKGNKQMEQRQRQEVAEMYKRNNFNPASMFLTAIVSMPIFLAMWRVVQGIAVIKSTTWLGINFSATSWRELIFGQSWVYLILILFAIIAQLIAHLLPKLLNRKKSKRIMNENEIAAMKKQQKSQNIIIVVFMVFYLLWQAGIQIYSIFGALWTIGQTLAVHYYRRSNHFKQKLRPWLFKEKK